MKPADSLPGTARTDAPPGVEGAVGKIPPVRQYDHIPAHVWVLGAAMAVTIVVTGILMLRDYSSESYIYLTFFTIPATCAISVIPLEPVVIWFGKFADIWLVAGAATLGSLIAGVLDHLVFVPVLSHRALQGYRGKRWYRKAMDVFLRFPFVTLATGSFLPLPYFPLKFLAFSIHYPLWKYMTALAVSRYPRYLLLAWLGAYFQIPDWVLIAIFAGIILVYAVNLAPGLLRRLREKWRARHGSGSGGP